MSPLTQLLHGDADLPPWVPAYNTVFTTLHLLVPPPILRHFDPMASTEVHTGTSGVGLSSSLAEQKPGYSEYIVNYVSRTLMKVEANYSVTEKECLALVWALVKFLPYLCGRPFDLVTDQHTQYRLAILKDPAGHLGRWELLIQ